MSGQIVPGSRNGLTTQGYPGLGPILNSDSNLLNRNSQGSLNQQSQINLNVSISNLIPNPTRNWLRRLVLKVKSICEGQTSVDLEIWPWGSTYASSWVKWHACSILLCLKNQFREHGLQCFPQISRLKSELFQVRQGVIHRLTTFVAIY